MERRSDSNITAISIQSIQRLMRELCAECLLIAPTPETLDEAGETSLASLGLVTHFVRQIGELDHVERQIEEKGLAGNAMHWWRQFVDVRLLREKRGILPVLVQTFVQRFFALGELVGAALLLLAILENAVSMGGVLRSLHAALQSVQVILQRSGKDLVVLERILKVLQRSLVQSHSFAPTVQNRQ
ncbi:hypothetical protein X777_09358 [Ooceraea biroi]|uniref:Uncharacterized protein n=1 Tax=Ooceraea biroi TaxID=2015173 RepID=A0A026X0E3_OOCBI|nr:hypothetical protein X777_09358 [Ooceraea biroi]